MFINYGPPGSGKTSCVEALIWGETKLRPQKSLVIKCKNQADGSVLYKEICDEYGCSKDTAPDKMAIELLKTVSKDSTQFVGNAKKITKNISKIKTNMTDTVFDAMAGFCSSGGGGEEDCANPDIPPVATAPTIASEESDLHVDSDDDCFEILGLSKEAQALTLNNPFHLLVFDEFNCLLQGKEQNACIEQMMQSIKNLAANASTKTLVLVNVNEELVGHSLYAMNGGNLIVPFAEEAVDYGSTDALPKWMKDGIKGAETNEGSYLENYNFAFEAAGPVVTKLLAKLGNRRNKLFSWKQQSPYYLDNGWKGRILRLCVPVLQSDHTIVTNEIESEEGRLNTSAKVTELLQKKGVDTIGEFFQDVVYPVLRSTPYCLCDRGSAEQ